MKVVILAGGTGTRLSEETEVKPKPMVEIGGNPALWHIMKIFSHYGHTDFVICLGYKGYVIKEYFANYFLHKSDITVDIANNAVEAHSSCVEPWRVTLVDTGAESGTGARLAKVRKYLGNEAFMLTYGDGVADVDINALLAFHKKHGKIATITAIEPPGRFGALELGAAGKVARFVEKPKGGGTWINGGFFVFEPRIFKYLKGGAGCMLEQYPLETLAKKKELVARKHQGFWQAMDTLRDKRQLDALCRAGHAPWMVWKNG
jgi:glucose-1-phosphate cytidylyltransferase